MAFALPFDLISKESIEYMVDTISENGIDYSEAVIRELILFEFGIDTFNNVKDLPIDEHQKKRLENDIDRIITHEPVQYITNTAPFFGHDFYVDKRVLIPRFDTEILVENALDIVKSGDSVLDICSGSGCIGLSIAFEKNIDISFADVSQDTKEVLKKNYLNIFQDNEIYKNRDIVFYKIDILKDPIPVDKCHYDVIVSNPPYISTGDLDSLNEDVKKEPVLALDGGDDGLVFYRPIIKEAFRVLKNGGTILLEHGIGQEQNIRQILKEHTFTAVEYIKDLNGINRVIKAKKGVN